MIVERIRNLNITKRPVFTCLYGCLYGQEYFVEDNLCKYSYWQELYRYLRGEGYTTVFYNEAYNFYSYEESQLETLFFKRPEEISKETDTGSNTQGKYISQFASPNGNNRRSGIRLTDSGNKGQEFANLVSHNPGILVKTIEHGKNKKGDQFFQLRSREQVMDRLFDFMDHNPDHKLAVVFTMPSAISFGRMEPSNYAKLQARLSQQEFAGSGLRLIVLYDFNEVTQLYESLEQGGAFFFDTWFKNKMFPLHQEGRSDLHKPSPALFHVCSMGKDEVGNALRKMGIVDELLQKKPHISFDDLCTQICRQFSKTKEETNIHTLSEFMELPVSEVKNAILKMENESAYNRLKKLYGIDKLIEQFEKYVKAYHRSKIHKEKFRPHMVFMGNPGTGKTTVARLFGEILQEEGFLPQGQFVEATPCDLIGQYIGQTRIKAAALCDRAKGGVLFIDEAYGLMSGVNDNGNADFGKEAIEVLIQFMENNDDSIVILAGYPEETMRLINEWNPGFKSRFNEKYGFFHFEDYEPDVLYQIAKKNIPEEIETTPAFDKALHDIVVLKHAFRSKIFGNARAMENMVATIVSSYYDSGDDGPLDVRHLPDKLRVLVDPAMYDEKVMLAELNQKIVGQQQIKHFVRHLYLSHLAERTMMSNIEGYKPKLLRLNFIFAGNPGTGKTTVARIIGNLLQKMGVLSSNDDTVLTEVLGGDVANMSPAQIQDLFEDNIGKVLLIDEAYMLAENTQALTEILSNATNSDYRGKLCLILAGYTTEMHQMMRLNPGMSSRFEEVIFHDYTNKELWEILKRKINASDSEFSMDEQACKEKALHYFASLERGPHFGNARIVEELLLQLKSNLSKRCLEATDAQKADPDFARKILSEDFPYIHVDPILSSPMKRLEEMRGLDNIKKQFERYRDAFKRYRDGKTPGKFHQHMAFMGNPGTGKTTVARLFAEILHEEGLLPQGQFVEATPADLIGQYIGQTRVKAAALCDRAKGGVLFIDEAYGLMSDANEHGNVDYGQEAIEVLIQFMENSDDSLVILAGYPEETMRLINEGNPGFKSRFNESLGFFHFEDYEHQEDGNIDVDCIPEQNRIPEVSKKQLKEELMLLANELQEKLQQLQSKLNELSEE